MEKIFTINLRVNIPYVIRFLAGLILACIFVAFLRGFIIYTTGQNAADGLLAKFNMDLEQTLPTYISTINLLIASALLALVAKFKRGTGDRYWVHWGLLSLGFLFLSIDENVSVHEVLVSSFVMQFLNISGPAHFGAGIFILVCAVISGLFFLKFLLHLPKKTQGRFIVSGVIFVLGAAGMEAIGGYVLSDGYQKVSYNVGVIIEESLEMIGVFLFIRAILYYIQENLLHNTSMFEEVAKSSKPQVPQQEQELTHTNMW